MKNKQAPMTDEGKRVGIWIRVSTEDQAHGDSPEHHEKRGRQYAEVRGWRVREVYHLEAVSGKSVMGHPEAVRMLEHVRAGHVSGLIFSKLARLARNTRELLEFSEIFREHGADLISLQEAIDTSSPAGRLFFTVIAAMAQWEREEIAERVAASVPIRAKLGKPLGGAAPYGYKWQNRELVPDPKEAPVRKLMYELFTKNPRKKAVARLLNEAGHRTRNGSKFTDTTVGRLLADPTAKGVRRANYTRSLGEKKHWKFKPESEWVLSSVQPVVSDELWAQCNALLEGQKQTGRRNGRAPVKLFTGIACCSCGEKMYVPSNSPKYICRKCRNKIPVDDLENVFQEQLKAFLLSPEEISRYLGQADQVIRDKEELLKVLEEEHEKIQREMDKLYKLYMADEITMQGFGASNRPLEARRTQLDDEIPKLQGELDFLKIQYLSSDQTLTEARDLYARWPELEWSEKRRIVETLAHKIVIGKGEVTIDLCYLPTSSEIMAKRQHNFRGSWRPPA